MGCAHLAAAHSLGDLERCLAHAGNNGVAVPNKASDSKQSARRRGDVLAAGLRAFVERLDDGSLHTRLSNKDARVVRRDERSRARCDLVGGAADKRGKMGIVWSCLLRCVALHLSASIAAVEQDYHLARFDDLSGFGSH